MGPNGNGNYRGRPLLSGPIAPILHYPSIPDHPRADHDTPCVGIARGPAMLASLPRPVVALNAWRSPGSAGDGGRSAIPRGSRIMQGPASAIMPSSSGRVSLARVFSQAGRARGGRQRSLPPRRAGPLTCRPEAVTRRAFVKSDLTAASRHGVSG